MRRPIKILIAIGTVAAVILIGLSIFVKSYLTDERIRVFLTEAAEKSLNRKVEIGTIRVSLWRGIVVKDLSVKEKDSENLFLKAKDFVLRYRLFPLLSGRLIIDEVHLVEPRVSIRKNPDGSFNFSDIGKPISETAAEKTGSRGLPVSLEVRSVAAREALLEYHDPAGPVQRASISVDADLEISSGSPDILRSKGKMHAFLKELVLKDGKRPLKNLEASITYLCEADTASKKLMLRSVDAEIMKIPLHLKGEIGYGDPASHAVTITIPETNLSSIRGISVGFLPEGMSLGGALSMDLTSVREPVKESKTAIRGRVQLKEVSLGRKGMQPVLNGTVEIEPVRITLQGFRLRVGDSNVDILGRIEHYATTPDVRLDLRSKFLNLDAILPGPREQKPTQPAPASKAAEKEFEPMRLKVKAGGSLNVEKATFRGVAVRNLRAVYELKDSVFTIASLSGNTLSGSFTARSSVDLSQRGARYAISANADGVRMEDLVNSFAPKAKDKLTGTLQARTEISGAGTTKGNIKRNLKGKGTFSIKDGALRNAEISNMLLSFLGLQDLREIKMQKAEGNFTIADGTIDLKSLIESKDLILDERGAVGLDGGLDIGLLVKASDRLTPRLVSQSSIATFLSEEKGWTSIPLRLGGTIEKPSYSVDTKAVGKKATEKVRKKVEEELLKTLSGEKGKKGEPGKKEQRTPGDLFKGIFGN